ncbi:hypothetical protein PAPHI01_2406 [Pancytospora philotis]|nr:hypothetical protein PAPHI01_2406 [Pancytospora philotis]
MNFLCTLTWALAMLWMLFGADGSAIAKDKRIHPEQPFSGFRRAYLSSLVEESSKAQEKEAMDKLVREMLFRCYHADQPTISQSDRANGSLSVLQRVCASDFYMSEPPRKRRRQRRVRKPRGAGRQLGAQDDADGKAVTLGLVDESERTDRESGRALYAVIQSLRVPTPTQPAVASTPAAEDGSEYSTPKSTTPDSIGTEHDIDRNFVLLYDGMGRGALPARDENAPRWEITPFGRYFLECARFRQFLAAWEPSDGNADFHITRVSADRIQTAVLSGTPYERLSKRNKLAFAKLLFVRNALEVFGIIKAAKESLGFVLDERKTADSFLQAMFEYLMAVHASDGMLEVAPSVMDSIIGVELFSLAYIECTPDRVVLSRNSREMIFLSELLASEAHEYITNAVVLFQAWEESSSTNIDPEVLKKVGARVRRYLRERTGSYEEGCRPIDQ